MFFYVDESGHTGTNLFDENQPVLYYGVLSSKLNLDLLANNHISPLRKKLGVDRLHAGELGNGKLVTIIKELKIIQKKFNLYFDMYRVSKADHALISFFDQVFDQGLNPAMTWTGYWTPLRYVLLLKVASLFDEDTLKKAWSARIERNNEAAQKLLVEVCKTIRSRISHLPDERSRELVNDALLWVEKNPSKIHYNAENKSDILSITPNVIGFQAVMHGITNRLNKQKKCASQIIVDQQTQFNKAQNTLHEFYISAKDIPFKLGPHLPEMDLKNIPVVPISFTAGQDSAGLELVDIYLWVIKRFIEKKSLAPELLAIVQSQMHRGRTDEISLKAISDRWQNWFEGLPEPTTNELTTARAILAPDEERRLKAVDKLLEN